MSEIILRTPRFDSKHLPLSSGEINQRKKVLQLKTKQLQDYIYNKSFCRSQVLLNYFDEKDSITCGICDICLSKNFNKKEFRKQVRNELLKVTQKNSIHIPKFVQRYSKIKLKAIIDEINLMLKEDILIKTGEILRQNETK
jgi:ATP-dependent DNA helicase RecQ